MKKLIAATLLVLTLASPAAAATLTYSFSPGSFYNYSPTPNMPVSGSFKFDTSTGLLSDVDYNSVSGHFTSGAEYAPGVATEIYFGTFGSNYDVYQLGGSLINGGTVDILSGTHPSIAITAGGSLTSAVTAAVPEPTTWAMLLLGFGMIGFAMRKRSNVRTTVSYA